MIFVLIATMGLCFCLGVLYPIIACTFYKVLGGRKPIKEYIKTL